MTKLLFIGGPDEWQAWVSRYRSPSGDRLINVVQPTALDGMLVASLPAGEWRDTRRLAPVVVQDDEIATTSSNDR